MLNAIELNVNVFNVMAPIKISVYVELKFGYGTCVVVIGIEKKTRLFQTAVMIEDLSTLASV
jgi:hypothetical protein